MEMAVAIEETNDIWQNIPSLCLQRRFYKLDMLFAIFYRPMQLPLRYVCMYVCIYILYVSKIKLNK